MFGMIFKLFLIFHIVGDFYLQSSKVAEKKQAHFSFVAIHSLFYALTIVICIIPFWSIQAVLIACCLAVLHFLIDSAKFLLASKKEGASWVYIADQLAHISSLVIVAAIFVKQGNSLQLLPAINEWLSALSIDKNTLIMWSGFFLSSILPAKLMIRQLIAKYKPQNISENPSDTPYSAGALIGILERILILALLSVGQYAAIGLVLTAKSVARYDQIAKQKDFAEYYLLGTLLSTLWAVGIFFIFS